MENPKPVAPKGAVPKPKEVPQPAAPVKVPPLFRAIDWLTLLLTFGVVWAVYIWTLAPELTLEDSGELCTGSYYAGIPHPPGYPFWSIYSWLWTVILPVGNVAWRVEMGESFAAALGCGLLGFMVSRGSSMLIEGIEELKNVTSRWETAICMVSGFVAGTLLGLDGYMWKESVAINRISLFGVPWLIGVLALLMRWIYAPQQRRYLYLAMLCYGICATIHQTLLLSIIGIEVLIALVQPKLGRDMFLWNAIGYLGGWVLILLGNIPAINNMASIEVALFHIVGLGSFAAWNGMYLKPLADEGKVNADWLRLLLWSSSAVVAGFVVLFLLIAIFKTPVDLDHMTFKSTIYLAIDSNLTHITKAMAYPYGVVLAVCSLVSIWMGIEARQFARQFPSVALLWLIWFGGVLFYLYMPVSGMTVPPMQWGYPRTVEGFFHALSRGQYETMHGTNMFQNPTQFLFQIGYLVEGLAGSFSWVYMLIGLLPFLFIRKMHSRERSWIIGVSAIYFCVSVLLVNLLNVTSDRSSSDLNKVFCTASHGLFAMMIGYGLTLLAAYVATHYQNFRRWGFLGGGIAVMLALYCLMAATAKLYYGASGQLRVWWLPDWEWLQWFGIALGPKGQLSLGEIPHCIAKAFTPDQYGLPVYASLILLAIPLVFLAALALYRKRGPVLILLGLFIVMPVCSGLSHWYKSEQRNHWFGYWFGHDMFTPPFKDPATGKLSYDNVRRAELLKDPKNASRIYPEMARDTILFGGTDPGRFCPTYIIFCESFIPHRCQPEQDQKFDRRDVYIITQNALADGTYLDYLRSQYNRSKQIDPPFFSELSKYVFNLAIHGWRKITGDAIDKKQENYLDKTLADMADPQVQQMLAYYKSQEDAECDHIADTGLFHFVNTNLFRILDRPTTAWGKHVETRRRAEGVYPPVEIYIPSPADSQHSFEEYTQDARRRAQHDQQFPNEPRQIRPGEEVHEDAAGRVQVSGQAAVMNINGLLCKVIFDHCPTNEFYVEESFPLEWMYPYETPFGVIMKINRNPLPELTQDIFDLDHRFWKDFAPRLCGDFINYDTTVKEICDFAERTYVGNNYKGFTGNRAFVRDDDGQKAFSKLRSSQAGMYAWRCALPGSTPPCPPEFRQKSEAAQAALIRETDFAFKQAFAFCPYSPEAVYRYINFLLPLGRFDDAILIVQTCKKLDPYNESLNGLLNNLEDYKKSSAARTQAFNQLDAMENTARTNPSNVQNLLSLAGAYLQMQNTSRATELFDLALRQPAINLQETVVIIQNLAQLNDIARLETARKKLASLVDAMEKTAHTNPTNVPNLLSLAGAYMQMQNTNRAAELFDLAFASPAVKYEDVAYIAQFYAAIASFPKLDAALQKLVALSPGLPEPRFDLAALQAMTGRVNEAMQNLKIALEGSAKRLATNPAAHDLAAAARNDPRFAVLRTLPEFQKLVLPK